MADEPETADTLIHTRTNKALEFNLGTFNIPTVVGLLGIMGMIWSQSAGRATLDANFATRLDAIEKDRAVAKIQFQSDMKDLQTTSAIIPNMQYRLTITEQNIASLGDRVDRQSEALNNFRDTITESIGALGTKIEVLTQRLEIAVPLKRGSIEDLTETPKELAPQIHHDG